jgi:hypothetical protein
VHLENATARWAGRAKKIVEPLGEEAESAASIVKVTNRDINRSR